MTDQEICLAIMNRTRATFVKDASVPEALKPSMLEADERITEMLFDQDDNAASSCVRVMGRTIRRHMKDALMVAILQLSRKCPLSHTTTG